VEPHNLILRSIAQRCVSIARGNPRAVMGNDLGVAAPSRRALRALLGEVIPLPRDAPKLPVVLKKLPWGSNKPRLA
jgi:hypothetical protein